MRSQITINLCILSLVSAGIACITIMHVASYQISVKVSGSCLLGSFQSWNSTMNGWCWSHYLNVEFTIFPLLCVAMEGENGKCWNLITPWYDYEATVKATEQIFLTLHLLFTWLATATAAKSRNRRGNTTTSTTRNPKIMFGFPTRDGEFGWQASLELLHPSLGFIGHWCGGVLIHKYWVLSSAHCIHKWVIIACYVPSPPTCPPSCWP